MKNYLVLAIFLVFLTDCSAPSTKNAAALNSNFDRANTDSGTSNIRLQNINAQIPATEEFTNANNAAPDPSIKSPGFPVDVRKKNLKGKFADVAPVDPNASRMLMTAPDNSEISTEMNKQGQIIETRVFKDNARLIKIIRINAASDNPAIKVCLKNGQTLDLSKDKIANAFAASADEILQAVGVAPQKSNSPSEKSIRKKRDQ